MWVRDHRPDEYHAATGWTDLGDYVLCGLGGEPVMDWTHASRAGAFDLVERAWDRESCEAAGIDVAFPRLVASGSIVGSVSAAMAQRTGLPIGVAIVSGGHDHLCAAYGAGLRGTAELFLSAGTSEAHLALIDAPMSGDTGRYHIDQGCYVDGADYYAHINIHSGHFFRQWRSLLYADTDDQAMYAQLEAAPVESEVTFELAEDLRHARLDSVPYGAGPATLMRAILEGLAARSADIVDHLEQASGRPFELILAAGHPTQIPLWRSLRSVAYGRPMAAVGEPESAAFGAAVIAARATAGSAADGLVARRVAWE
jgi:xylulokinase